MSAADQQKAVKFSQPAVEERHFESEPIEDALEEEVENLAQGLQATVTTVNACCTEIDQLHKIAQLEATVTQMARSTCRPTSHRFGLGP